MVILMKLLDDIKNFSFRQRMKAMTRERLSERSLYAVSGSMTTTGTETGSTAVTGVGITMRIRRKREIRL